MLAQQDQVNQFVQASNEMKTEKEERISELEGQLKESKKEVDKLMNYVDILKKELEEEKGKVYDLRQ